MKIFLIIVLCLIAAVALFLAYRSRVVSRQAAAIAARRYESISPLRQKLDNDTLTESDVHNYAADIITRQQVWQLLYEHDKLELFPSEYNTKEKAAETVLANWLEFPTELDAKPDEMELLKMVPIQIDEDPTHRVLYFVFRFCTHEPHWAARNGWMIGVAGPYFDEGPTVTQATAFSRFTRQGDASIEKEVRWFHKNVAASFLQ